MRDGERCVTVAKSLKISVCSRGLVVAMNQILHGSEVKLNDGKAKLAVFSDQVHLLETEGNVSLIRGTDGYIHAVVSSGDSIRTTTQIYRIDLGQETIDLATLSGAMYTQGQGETEATRGNVTGISDESTRIRIQRLISMEKAEQRSSGTPQSGQTGTTSQIQSSNPDICVNPNVFSGRSGEEWTEKEKTAIMSLCTSDFQNFLKQQRGVTSVTEEDDVVEVGIDFGTGVPVTIAINKATGGTTLDEREMNGIQREILRQNLVEFVTRYNNQRSLHPVLPPAA